MRGKTGPRLVRDELAAEDTTCGLCDKHRDQTADTPGLGLEAVAATAAARLSLQETATREKSTECPDKRGAG